MKKVIIGLVVIVMLVGGGAYLVFSNLDAIVKSAIETAGSRALGTQVQVGSVSLDLLQGNASIYDFSIANPQGFTDEAMASFAELSVSLDVQNLSADNIHIFSIVTRNPHVYYESRNGTTNVDTISSRLSSNEEAIAAEETSGEQPRLVLDSILVENIRGTLQDDRLPAPVDVSLGDISLRNLDGTPNELVGQIMQPLLEQLARAGAEALVKSIPAIQQQVDEAEQRVRETRDQLQEQADDIRNQADEALKLFSQ